MSDPRRLWQSRDASATEREALRVAREIEPPAELRDEVWHGLVAAIPPLGVAGAGAASMQGGAGVAASGTATASGGAVATGATVGGAAILPLIKVVLVGAVLGGAALGTTWVASTAGPSNRSTTTTTTTTTTTATAARRAIDPAAAPDDLPRAADPAVSAVAFEQPSTAPASPTTLPRPAQGATAARAQLGARSAGGPAPVSPANGTEIGVVDAREESRLVARAREALRAGNPAEAISLLDQVRLSYPSGVLVQEREALAIEALVTVGKRELALDRARAFVRMWPESPYAGRVRALTEGTPER